MSQSELLIRVLDFLESNNIEYMVSGSVVSSLQGEPRSTHDADIVVNIVPATAALLTQSFPSPQYYISETAIMEAIQHQSMFNLLNTSGGDKVDFWILTNDGFDQERFKRKIRQPMSGLSMFVSTPEDTILMKLRWCNLSGWSEKQFHDAKRVYEMQHRTLDFGYLEHWAHKISVASLWIKLKEEAVPLE